MIEIYAVIESSTFTIYKKYVILFSFDEIIKQIMATTTLE